MITVRFPDGFSVQYNSANYVTRDQIQHGFADLYTEKDGKWVAQVPVDAMIEVMTPCRTYDAKNRPQEIVRAILAAIDEQRSALPVHDLARLKSALYAFDARKKRWKW